MNSEWESMEPGRESSTRPGSRPTWTEDMAKYGLAILNYPDKWDRAQTLCTISRYYHGSYEGYSYWERVRCMFLELGGCLIEQLLPYQQKAYGPVEPTAEGFTTIDGVGAVTFTLGDPQEFGGSDELKAHLHEFWAAELAHDLRMAGL